MKYAGAALLSIRLNGGLSSRISCASSSAASSDERVTRVSIFHTWLIRSAVFALTVELKYEPTRSRGRRALPT